MQREELHITIEPGHVLLLVFTRRSTRPVRLSHVCFQAHPGMTAHALHSAFFGMDGEPCGCPSMAADIAVYVSIFERKVLNVMPHTTLFETYIAERYSICSKRINKRQKAQGYAVLRP